MKKVTILCTALFLSLSAFASGAFATTVLKDFKKVDQLTFETDIPNTLQDYQGLGTGFVHRLPGTGGALPQNDPNLAMNLSTGLLAMTSTPFDINRGGVNLDTAETAALLLPNVGQKDFAFSIVLRGVQVSEPSDQLFAFVGTDAQHVFRFGPHFSEGPVLMSVESLDGWDYNWRVPGILDAGDDLKITLVRTAGNQYTIEYKNLTHPEYSATDLVSFDWLNGATDLYVGIMYANNGGYGPDNRKTSNIESFRTYLPKAQ